MMANEKDIQTILERSGYKIQPYSMACVAKDAAKIVGILFGNGAVAYTAEEASMLLDLAKLIHGKAVNGNEPAGLSEGMH